MENFKLSFLFVLLSFSITAQDQYHTDLQALLMEDYNLPTATYLMQDEEVQNYSEATSYGSSASIVDIDNELFSKVFTFNVGSAGDNPWNSGFFVKNTQSVQTGDKVLLVFSIKTQSGIGKVNFFAENSVTFDKEVLLTLDVTDQWRLYYIPIDIQNNYGVGSLNIGFHLGFQAQVIEVGGFTGLNYDNTVELADLPEQINNDLYDGSAPDAPWRAAAETRIQELRKANLTIEAKDLAGNPTQGSFHVEMQQHEFSFGTAVKGQLLANNDEYNIIYENKLINLDGQGHGFNCAVFENDMKWPAWESEWFVSKTELIAATQFLANAGMEIRGHTLVWPGLDNLPDDIADNTNDIDYIKDRIDTHLETILNYDGISEHIDEWDVLNETVTNTSLQDIFAGNPGYTTGRELYPEIFDKARAEDSDIGLWINDYMTISLNTSPGSPNYDVLKRNIGEIVDAGVDIEGIGFQAHVGGFPNGIPSVLATFDDFYDSFGLKAKITEFDMPTIVSEELGAQYLSDFLKATFSHPSMDGFVFWNFWDNATWLNPGSNLYRDDWSEKPAHGAFVDLLFDEWWTDEYTVTDINDGLATVDVFKGEYKITYECNGETIEEFLNITEDETFTINCDNLTTSTKELSFEELQISVFPNPASNFVTVSRPDANEATLRLLDVSGKEILSQSFEGTSVIIQVDELRGYYLLEYLENNIRSYKKIIVQ